MSEEKKDEVKQLFKDPSVVREVTIQTDGNSINIKDSKVTVLELREICRQILEKTN